MGERLHLRHAAWLALAQGPTELLPVSSSAHTTLIPFLLNWPYLELEPEVRKSFEVALHAGAGLALALGLRGELRQAAADRNLRGAAVLALSLAPPAIAGYLLEDSISRQLGRPRAIAAGLAVGAIAMALADARASRRALGRTRCRDELGYGDGLALGLAQAAALLPGVSRRGATLTAALARGFGRADAGSLSWGAALPVIAGASGLRAARMARAGGAAGVGPMLAVGAGGAFCSTLLSARLATRARYAERSLLGYSLYRCLLAGVVWRRLGAPRRASAHNRDA